MNDRRMTTPQNELAAQAAEHAFATPPVDVFENDDELLLVADLPGVSRDDLALRYERGQLKLEATRTVSNGKKKVTSYSRIFSVEGVDPDRISAVLDNGVLSVHLPRDGAQKPRQVPITCA